MMLRQPHTIIRYEPHNKQADNYNSTAPSPTLEQLTVRQEVHVGGREVASLQHSCVDIAHSEIDAMRQRLAAHHQLHDTIKKMEQLVRGSSTTPSRGDSSCSYCNTK